MIKKKSKLNEEKGSSVIHLLVGDLYRPLSSSQLLRTIRGRSANHKYKSTDKTNKQSINQL